MFTPFQVPIVSAQTTDSPSFCVIFQDQGYAVLAFNAFRVNTSSGPLLQTMSTQSLQNNAGQLTFVIESAQNIMVNGEVLAGIPDQPVVAFYNGKMYLAYTGRPELYCHGLTNTAGANAIPAFSVSQSSGGEFGKSPVAPALTANINGMYAAWLDSEAKNPPSSNAKIKWAIYNSSSNAFAVQGNLQWSGKSGEVYAGTIDSPSLALFGDYVYLAWTGDDGFIWWSRYATSSKQWSHQKRVGDLSGNVEDYCAGCGPSIYVHSNNVLIVWKGHTSDNLYYTIMQDDFMDGNTWSPRTLIGSGLTASRPFVNFVDDPTNPFLFYISSGELGNIFYGQLNLDI